MAFLTNEQRVFLVKRYLETKNCRLVLEEFRQRFPEQNVPSKSTIYKNVRKYEIEGTSRNLHKGRSGRRRSSRNAENIEAVRNFFQDNPVNNVSCRRNPLNLPKSSFNRIMKLDLLWHPYKMHIRNKLLPADMPRRIRYSRWLLDRCANLRFLHNVVIGDEATFSMKGEVSTQNVRMYAPKGNPPSYNYDVNNSRQKVTVWVGICGNGTLLGPFFSNTM